MFGRRLSIGDTLQSVDVYDSTSGQWSPCPCPGVKIQAGETVFVRPAVSPMRLRSIAPLRVTDLPFRQALEIWCAVVALDIPAYANELLVAASQLVGSGDPEFRLVEVASGFAIDSLDQGLRRKAEDRIALPNMRKPGARIVWCCPDVLANLERVDGGWTVWTDQPCDRVENAAMPVVLRYLPEHQWSDWDLGLWGIRG